MWRVALDSSHVLLPYSITSLVSPKANILISILNYIYEYLVLLAGGPFLDQMRGIYDDPSDESFKKAVRGASGVHVILPQYFGKHTHTLRRCECDVSIFTYVSVNNTLDHSSY